MNRKAAVAAVAPPALAVPAAADAHVTLQPNTAAAGAFTDEAKVCWSAKVTAGLAAFGVRRTGDPTVKRRALSDDGHTERGS